MSTNTPGKHPDIKGVTVGAVVEVPFSFDGVPTVLNFLLHATSDVALYVSLVPGGTFAPDNRFTIPSGGELRFDDLAWTPDVNGLYLRSAGAELFCEVFYWG